MQKTIRVGINGFGRIGRQFTRLVFSTIGAPIEIVAINDPGAIEALSHLLRFDSVHGSWNADIAVAGEDLKVNGNLIKVFHESSPAAIPWKDMGVDIVLEATGRFRSTTEMSQHIKAGAPRVMLSAVSSSPDVKTIVMGANEHLLDGSEEFVSNASCTTNCAAPLVDVVMRRFGIDNGYVSTVHSYTSDQSLHDRAHSDLRRARAAALSIIPTTTGAARAITRVFPELEGRMGGAGIRVPVPNGSLTDITFIVGKNTSVEEVNEAFRGAASGKWRGILEYTDLPLVSSDIIGNRHSCIFDSQLTSVLGKMVKVVGWYDNEAGYSSRLIDLMVYWSKLWVRP